LKKHSTISIINDKTVITPNGRYGSISNKGKTINGYGIAANFPIA
jgi:hypothetical protein